MPLSLSQITLRKDCLQVEFHPIDNTLIALFRTGEIKCFAPSGTALWSHTLPWIPIVFRINVAGGYLVILGEGTVLFLYLQSHRLAQFAVASKVRLLELYKNCVMLGGNQKSISFITQNGKEFAHVEFDFFIRMIKSVPLSDYFLVYNDKRQLLCCDITGESRWELGKYLISGHIETSNDGELCLFMKKPYELIRFDVSGTQCFEISSQLPIKHLSLSPNGQFFIILDIENNLRLYNRDMEIVWQNVFDHVIDQTGSSAFNRGEVYL